jgi:hypothetical protein
MARIEWSSKTKTVTNVGKWLFLGHLRVNLLMKLKSLSANGFHIK